MKRKIAFIDYSIDEWHANHAPGIIAKSSLADEFEIAGAWEKTPGPTPLNKWCAERNVRPYDNLDKLIEECDGLYILAPSNPEAHEEIAYGALASGKPVFIDKPLALEEAAAERMFARAEAHNTPMFSCSSLRYGTEIQEVKGTFPIEYVSVFGDGHVFWEEAIHPLEMIVTLMGTNITSLMHTRSGEAHHIVFRFDDGRVADMTMHSTLWPYSFCACGPEVYKAVPQVTDYFENQVEVILKFFKDRIVPIPQKETIDIVRILRVIIESEARLNEWVKVR